MTESQGGELSRNAPEITLNGIVNAVSQYYGFSQEELLGKDRSDSALQDARSIMFTLISDHTPLSHERMADVLDRGQSSISTAIRRVRTEAEDNPKIREHLEMLAQAARGEPLQETLATWPELVTEHYGMPMEEITAGSSMRALEARQVIAHLLRERTILRKGAISRRAGFSSSAAVSRAVSSLVEKRAKDPALDERVAQLEAGELPESLKEEDVFRLVESYYDISHEDMTGTDRKDRYTRPRLMAMHLLVREAGYNYSEAGRSFGRGSNIRERLLAFEERMAADKRLQRQRAEILDPKSSEHEPAGKRLIRTVCDFYDVDPDELVEEHPSDKFMRPRAVSIYLLREELGFSVREAMDLLQRSQAAVISAHGNVKSAFGDDPFLTTEVRYLRNAKRIRKSINERIIMRVSEATGVSEAQIVESKEPEAAHARRMAVYLLAERSHLTSTEVSRLFGMSGQSAVYRARTVIDHARPNDARLSQQLEYVRQGVLSERPGTFEFDPQAVSETSGKTGDDLPVISEELVAPQLREQIYGIIKQVADFYDVPAAQLVSHEKDFELNRARRAALLMCEQARLPAAETAICFGNRAVGSVIKQAQNAAEYSRGNRLFAQEIAALNSGEPRRDALQDIMAAVAGFYDVKPADIAQGEDFWSARARRVFVAVMTELEYTTQRRLGEVIGRSEKTTEALTRNTISRLKDDPRLKAEVDYFLNPRETMRPPDAGNILAKICGSFDISLSELKEAGTPEARQARRSAVYILAEELSLTYNEIGDLLDMSVSNVPWHLRRTRVEIDRDPRRILEIDALKPAGAATLSMATRILAHINERFGVEPDDLSSSDRSPDLDKARRLAINLMQRAGYDTEQVSGILSLNEATVQEMTDDTFISSSR